MATTIFDRFVQVTVLARDEDFSPSQRSFVEMYVLSQTVTANLGATLQRVGGILTVSQTDTGGFAIFGDGVTTVNIGKVERDGVGDPTGAIVNTQLVNYGFRLRQTRSSGKYGEMSMRGVKRLEIQGTTTLDSAPD